jgi:hypothetical protein
VIPVRWAVPHLCGLSKSKRDKRLLLMFRGFFDESNRNAADVKFILAGWTASVEEWEKFSGAWQNCLSQNPRIKYFKTYEANNPSGQFLKIGVEDSKQKRVALAEIISKHKVRGYIATADHAILGNRPKKLRKLAGTRIYDWAFIALITTVIIDLLERGEREKIDFVFDACKELRACIESYEKQRAVWPPSMRSVAGEAIPGDDRELAGLQAADLLAGEHSAYLRTAVKGIPYRVIENMNVPVLDVAASPPPMMPVLLRYAQDVYERAGIVVDIVRELKKKGVKLDEFKNS